jgi:hypothetical protein
MQLKWYPQSERHRDAEEVYSSEGKWMARRRRAIEAKSLEKPHKIGESLDGIIVVGSARGEPHVQIHLVSVSHGCRSCIEIDGFAVRGDCAIEYGPGERSSEAETASAGTHPQTFHFPRIFGDLGR